MVLLLFLLLKLSWILGARQTLWSEAEQGLPRARRTNRDGLGVADLAEMGKNKVSDKAARHRINRQVSPVSRPTQWRSRVQEDCVTGCASCRYFVGVIFVANGSFRPSLQLCPMPCPGAYLHALRPWSDLLRQGLHPRGQSHQPQGDRGALSGVAPRPPVSRSTRPQVPRPAKIEASKRHRWPNRDAPGFPTCSGQCSTTSDTGKGVVRSVDTFLDTLL